MMKSILALLLYIPAMVFAQTALDGWRGNWTVSYTGGDSGTCSITISFSTTTQAAISGSCTSSIFNETDIISGQLDLNGGFIAGSSTTGVTFSGTLQGTSGSGQWNDPSEGISGNWTMSKPSSAPFSVAVSGAITATSATIDTRIIFNEPDLGTAGAVFVTAWVPASGLGTLGISVALNSRLSVTGTRGDSGATKSLQVTRETLAELDAGVLVQLTSSGWQLVVNGQLIPYASGVLGDSLASQSILNNTDPTNLKGAQFCLGYGATASAMIAAGRMQLVATIPTGSSATGTATASCIVQTTGSPLYRFFNNNAGGHFYTIDEAEKNTVIQNYNWFRYEGIGFYAYPVP